MLTDTAIRQARPGDKPRKIYDERGLFVLVHPNGSRYFRLKYTFNGRERTLALGVYDDVSLKRAREKRDEARKLLADGIDPSAQRQEEKRAARIQGQNTFERVGRAFIEIRKDRWSETQTKAVTRRLEANLIPALGSRPIGEIDAPELLDVLRGIEARGAIEEAHRTRALASQIFRFALAQKLCQRDPAGDLKGVLRERRQRNFAAVTDPAGVGRLLRAIDGHEGQPQTRAALQLLPLTLARPGELRRMEWQEIDWDRAVWTVPPEKMKGGQPHAVPLAPQAIEILRELYAITGRSRYAFPSVRSLDRPISENTLATALKTLGWSGDQMVPHGWRSVGATMLRERLGYDDGPIEAQLAHRRGGIAGIYDRTTHWDQRVRMVSAWADHLDALRDESGKVATLKSKRSA